MKIIFIASAPRSGSTWFSNLFNSHPDVIYRHEPLGRLTELIQTELFQKLKLDYGLQRDEQEKLIQFLLSANPETTRPPFFYKKYSIVPPKLLHLLWGGAMKFDPLKSIFSTVYAPRDTHASILVIKETGWSIHLTSILAGISPDHVLFLLRHPCAIVSSIKEGVALGLMREQDAQEKMKWFDSHKKHDFIVAKKISASEVNEYSDVEFWATKIRVLYDLFFKIKKDQPNKVNLVVYEDVQDNTLKELEKIFAFLGIDFCQSVHEFACESKRKNSSLLLPESNSEYFSVHRSGRFNPYKWKARLTKDEISVIEGIVGQEILEKFWPTSN